MSDTSRRVEGRHLFTFAIISDTHVNENEDRSPSPFRTNLLANARARFVAEEIAAMDPPVAFVVHLGDQVHPIPPQATYRPAFANYRAIMQAIKAPLYQVPGNHDIGDKALDWMPADIITDGFVATNREVNGPDRFAFEHGPVRGIGINSVLINSGLAEEAVQKSWLEAELARSAGKRILLFTHYPAFVTDPHEQSSYDNIDEPGRSWLLGLLRQHRVEAVFAGHVHNYWYDCIAGTDFYIQPSTTFIRHDYSELARTPPDDEFGRNQLDKFGYVLVDVYERGHVTRVIRSFGEMLKPDVAFAPRRLLPAPSPRATTVENVGVELRHPWAEVVEVPSTGGIQECIRRLARNDYPLLGLTEMGARLLKVPEQDVTTPATRQRMQVLRDNGHRFMTTSLGLPSPAFVEALSKTPDLVDAIEVNLSADRLAREVAALAALKRSTGRPILWSKLRMHDDARSDGGKFSHFVKCGLVPAELAGEPERLAERKARAAIDGVVVRLERGVGLIETVPQLAAFASGTGLAVVGTVLLADASLAKARNDDLDTARIVAETVLLGLAHRHIKLVFDTFMDVDRGYHPRTAFIDRRFAPRPALNVYAALLTLLGEAKSLSIVGVEARGSGRIVRVDVAGASHLLVSGLGDGEVAKLAANSGAQQIIDLCRRAVVASPAGAGAGASPGLWLLMGARAAKAS